MSNGLLTLGGFPLETTSPTDNVKVVVCGPPKIGKTSSVGRAYAVLGSDGVIRSYRICYIVVSDATALIPLGFQTLADGRTVAVPRPYCVHLSPRALPAQHKDILAAFWAIANELTSWFDGWTPQNRWWDAVAIDGVNFLGHAVEQHFEKITARNGWEKWKKLDGFFLDDLIAWATNLGQAQGHGLEVYFIGHSADPTYHMGGPRDGQLKTRGGLALPYKKLNEQFPGKVDLALRADTLRQPGKLEPARALFSRPEPEWMLGGRFDFLISPQEQLDLTEVLRRLRGYLGRTTVPQQPAAGDRT